MYNIYILYVVDNARTIQSGFTSYVENFKYTEMVGIFTSREKAQECIDNYNTLVDAYTKTGKVHVRRYDNFKICEVDFESLYEKSMEEYKDHPILGNVEYTHLYRRFNDILPHDELNIVNVISPDRDFTKTVLIYGFTSLGYRDEFLKKCREYYRFKPQAEEVIPFGFSTDFIDKTNWVYKVDRRVRETTYSLSMLLRDTSERCFANNATYFKKDPGKRGWSSVYYKKFVHPIEAMYRIDKQFFDTYGEDIKTIGTKTECVSSEAE